MSFVRAALQAGAPPGVTLRDRSDTDLPFLEALYASTREEELRPVPWPDAAKRAFLADQFAKQHAYYLEHYPGADWLVIAHAEVPVGRIYLHQSATDLRLMDVALVAAWRGRGLGTALMRALVAYADTAGCSVSLNVEPFNPARRLYERLGFAPVETRGYYQFMERPAAPRPPGG